MLSSSLGDPVAASLAHVPVDDEPVTDADLKAIDESDEDLAAGRVVTLEELRQELGARAGQSFYPVVQVATLDAWTHRLGVGCSLRWTALSRVPPRVWFASTDYNVFKGILGSPWAGLYNFELVFGDDYFWKVVRNTAIISLLKLGFGFPAPIIIALLLNEVLYMGFKRVIQTIIYLPHFISWVILAGIMINILSIHGGLVNEIVELFGGTPQSYLMKPDYFRPIVTTSHIWKTAGWGSIIYLAALAGINVKLYESAVIDGAATSIASANLRDPRVSGLSCARCRLGIVRQLAGAGPALVATREKCSRGRFIFGACGRRAGVPGR